jgi:hypothetical protein
MPDPPSGRPDRYEPLPGLLSLPGFLVGKLGRRGKVAVAVAAAILLAAVVAGAIVLVPKITETKRDNVAAERRERAAALRAERRRLIAEQRPHRAASPLGPATAPAARRALVRRVEAGITRDARRRAAAGALPPPAAQYSVCKPLTGEPAGVTVSRLSCVAVTSEVPGQGGERAGVVGHPFRARVDYGTGRYAWCKVSGRPVEGSFTRLTRVSLPRACGG